MSQCKMDNYVYKDCAINRTGRVKLSLKHINFGLASLALALASVQAVTAQAAEPRPSRDATGPRLIERRGNRKPRSSACIRAACPMSR